MELPDLEGERYGPVPWRVAVDAVADFVEVTGDDPNRWSKVAPPGFAAAALFSVAPALLDELYDHSIVHGEQTFTWSAPLAVGDLLTVDATVSRVRERGGVNFITFEMAASDGDTEILGGRSLFLASGESLPGDAEFERVEPPHSYRGEPGEDEVSASRSDLVRYAAATRDWNPVHWDHTAALAAGFPGVVVHGLLQAAWALRAATTGTESPRPLSQARIRFRNPLLPGRPARVAVERGAGEAQVVLSDADTEYMSAAIALAE